MQDRNSYSQVGDASSPQANHHACQDYLLESDMTRRYISQANRPIAVAMRVRNIDSHAAARVRNMYHYYCR